MPLQLKSTEELLTKIETTPAEVGAAINANLNEVNTTERILDDDFVMAEIVEEIVQNAILDLMLTDQEKEASFDSARAESIAESKIDSNGEDGTGKKGQRKLLIF